MKRAILIGAGAAGLLFATGAWAMPLAPQANVLANGVANADVQTVRLVCNRYGRCWRTGPRYGRGYYGGPYGYAPRAYVGPGYGYGYGYGPGYYGGGPTIGFSFGGGRW